MYDLFVSGDNEESVVDFVRQLWSSRYGLTRERELYEQIKGDIKGRKRGRVWKSTRGRGATLSGDCQSFSSTLG